MPAITQLFRKRAQVFVTEETTLDTVKTQAAGEAFLAEISDSFYTTNSENYQSTSVRGDFLSTDERPGLASAQISFRVALKGSGVADTAPEYADAFLACGYRESIVAASDTVSYYPFSTFNGATAAGATATRNPFGSATITVLEDGIAYRIYGAHGNVVFVGNVGEPIFAEFTYTGAYTAPIDDLLETVTYDSVIPPLFTGATFAYNFSGSGTPKGVTNFTLDTGNNVIAVNDVNNASGTYGARIVDRRSFGSFDPEAQTRAVIIAGSPSTWWWEDWRSGTAGTILTGVIDNGATLAQGGVSLSVNRAVYRAPELTLNEGIRKMTWPFSVSSAGSDVEGTNPDIQLQFTNVA